MLGYDDLKLRGDLVEKRGKCSEDAMYTFYIGRPIELARCGWCLLHRRPCLRKIHLAWLVYHKEVGNRTVMHTQEVLMQGKDSCNVIANPILTATNFPKKICSS